MTTTRATLPILFALSALGLSAPHAAAQAPETYHAVVTQPTAVRCGDMDRFYAVAELTAGTMVIVTGQSRSWAEVHYPEGVGAYITSADGEHQGDAVIVRRATTLRAPAQVSGPKGSWKPLLREPLPVGTRLELIQAVEGSDGREFFLVQAPDSARGYIDLKSLRRATDIEVAAITGQEAPTTQTTIIDPLLSTNTDSTNIPTNVASPDTTTPTPTPNPIATPTKADPAAASNSTNHTTSIQSSHTAIPELAGIEALESVFNQVRRNTDATKQDFDTLISRYTRAISALGESASDKALAESMQRRVGWLELQRDVREQLAVERTQAEVLFEEDQVARIGIDKIIAESDYLLIGRVLASSVYDGTRLPLMYRIQSVGEVTPRTVGYLRPEDVDADLVSLLGQTVGIVGRFSSDEQREQKLILAKRIDLIDTSYLD